VRDLAEAVAVLEEELLPVDLDELSAICRDGGRHALSMRARAARVLERYQGQPPHPGSPSENEVVVGTIRVRVPGSADATLPNGMARASTTLITTRDFLIRFISPTYLVSALNAALECLSVDRSTQIRSIRFSIDRVSRSVAGKGQ